VDEQHVKGAGDKIKGAVKDAVGGATGDSKLQSEGKLDKAKGSARKAVGDSRTRSATPPGSSPSEKLISHTRRYSRRVFSFTRPHLRHACLLDSAASAQESRFARG